jgi:hypothetical protein
MITRLDSPLPTVVALLGVVSTMATLPPPVLTLVILFTVTPSNTSVVPWLSGITG